MSRNSSDRGDDKDDEYFSTGAKALKVLSIDKHDSGDETFITAKQS